MEKIKLISDISASIASIVAIVGVLIGWYRSARKALTIERVVIHRKPKNCQYILVVRNRKDYPVEIKTTSCYTRKLYNIEKRPSQKPEYSEFLDLQDMMFRDKNNYTIEPSGHTDITIDVQSVNDEFDKLLFSMRTSHGYHEIWCKNIMTLDIGKGEVYELDYRHEYYSKLKAKLSYYWLLFKSCIWKM